MVGTSLGTWHDNFSWNTLKISFESSLFFFLFYSKKYVIHLQSFFSINEHQTFIKYVENMWNAWILLFRQFKLMQNLSSKLSFYINVFHMFSTFFISIWSLFTENNLCRCITYFLLKNKKEIKNFQKIFLEYSNTNYLDKCPVHYTCGGDSPTTNHWWHHKFITINHNVIMGPQTQVLKIWIIAHIINIKISVLYSSTIQKHVILL